MGTGAMLTRRVSWRALALHYPRGILGRNDRCGTPCSRFREHATQRKTWPTRSHWQDGHQYHRQFHLVAFTDRCSRATDHYSPVPRPTSGVRSCADPPPAGHLPDTDSRIAKDRMGPIWPSGPSILLCTEPGDSCGEINPLFLARRRRSLYILSWQEVRNASRSKRACRMAIRCNTCSLLALPDFPEFAQPVRYGVPGTPRPNGIR